LILKAAGTSTKVIADSVGAIQNELAKYNTYRPYFAMDGLTTIAYISSINLEAVA